MTGDIIILYMDTINENHMIVVIQMRLLGQFIYFFYDKISQVQKKHKKEYKAQSIYSDTFSG